MDKNNMDHDLSDIMKEIEALEQDFKNEEKAFAQSPIIQELAQLNEELSAPVGHKTQEASDDQPFDWLQGDNNNEEPLQVSEAEVFEMKAHSTPAATTTAAPEAVSTPVATAPVTPITQGKAAPTAKKEWATDSKMSFNFPEGMPVNVEFHRGHESLNFTWTQEGFHVEVEGGMSFTIPFSHCNKKAS